MENDLISRQAAIEELVRWGDIPGYNEGEKNMIGCVIGMLSSLPSAQPEILACGEGVLNVSVTNVGDMISKQAAIKVVRLACEEMLGISARCEAYLRALPAVQPELLTDKEQRIFLAAMGREEEVCKQVDDECRNSREPYEDSLVRTCHEIMRKVKGALWMI